jgi:hypothetical protein
MLLWGLNTTMQIKRKESDIQKECLHLLQILENQGKIYFIRCNVFQGKIKRANGTDGFIRQAKAGAPDIIVCVDGLFVGLEIKTESGKQSDLQKAAQLKIEKAGGKYFIIRSVRDLIYNLQNLV